MERRISAALDPHRRIGLDTSIFIYHFEGDPIRGPGARTVLSSVSRGSVTGVTSVVTVMELVVHPLQRGLISTAHAHETALARFANLSIAAIDWSIAKQAGELRARYRLHPADALQIAACLVEGATAFITNDLRLRHVTALDVLILEDFIDAT